MFSKKITDTDQFLDMPLSTQALYFHLNMSADDDGFIDSTKRVMRMIGASDDDLKLLMAKRFLIPFENGIVVIKDWRIHNFIRKDTYSKTLYAAQKAQLETDENGSYQLKPPSVDGPSTARIRPVDDPSPQVRLGKVRLGKDNKNISTADAAPPPWMAVIDYLNQQAGTHYKHTDSNKRLIEPRLKEGFTLADCKQVIDNKMRDWGQDQNMRQYLRPKTLFQASKFEGYLNERAPTEGSDPYGSIDF
jgi:uncharacterized phage protein (TIGR02220 family)